MFQPLRKTITRLQKKNENGENDDVDFSRHGHENKFHAQFSVENVVCPSGTKHTDIDASHNISWQFGDADKQFATMFASMRPEPQQELADLRKQLSTLQKERDAQAQKLKACDSICTDAAEQQAKPEITVRRGSASNEALLSTVTVAPQRQTVVPQRQVGLSDCALCGLPASCEPGSCFCPTCSSRMDMLGPSSPDPTACWQNRGPASNHSCSDSHDTASESNCSQSPSTGSDQAPLGNVHDGEISRCVLCGGCFICAADAQSSVLCENCVCPP